MFRYFRSTVSGINHEIEYNERMIREREAEIQDIGRASALINELFQNIGIIVHEQQDLIGKKEKLFDLSWIS